MRWIWALLVLPFWVLHAPALALLVLPLWCSCILSPGPYWFSHFWCSMRRPQIWPYWFSHFGAPLVLPLWCSIPRFSPIGSPTLVLHAPALALLVLPLWCSMHSALALLVLPFWCSMRRPWPVLVLPFWCYMLRFGRIAFAPCSRAAIPRFGFYLVLPLWCYIAKIWC